MAEGSCIIYMKPLRTCVIISCYDYSNGKGDLTINIGDILYHSIVSFGE